MANKLDFSLSEFEKIERWCDLLMQRKAWQQTQPNDEQLAMFKQTVLKLIKSQGEKEIVEQVKHS